MHVSTLLETLGASGLAYQGEPDQQFRGFTLRLVRGTVRRRFYMVTDESWDQRTRDAFEKMELSAEEAIRRAFEFEAAGVICPPSLKGAEVLEGRNVIFAESGLDAACRISAAIVSSLKNQRITAVTGSAGKSTTTAMITHGLRATGAGSVLSPSVAANRNFSRHVVEFLSRSHRNAHTVLEVSAATFFRNQPFSVSPDVAVITSIAEAHLERYGDLETVADVKSDLFNNPRPGGAAVINIDTARAGQLVRRALREGCQLITYGESAEASIRLVEYDETTSTVVARVGRETIEYTLGAHGKHMAMNSLAVIATLRAHRITNWREGVSALASFDALSGRGETRDVTLDNGARITLVDEAFNANPASIRASLATLTSRTVPDGARKIAVLGDVRELGESADAVHRSLADAVLSTDVDELHLFGEHMAALHDEIRDRMPHAQHWSDKEALTDAVFASLRTGDLVLAKASGSTGLKDFVKSLIAAENG